jgi:hypothetical protein
LLKLQQKIIINTSYVLVKKKEGNDLTLICPTVGKNQASVAGSRIIFMLFRSLQPKFQPPGNTGS